MEYTDVIYLLTKEISEDNLGNNIETIIDRKKIYAKTQSVKTKEFYSAMEVGLSPDIEFVIKKLNYSEQSEIEWNNQIYSVIRSVETANKYDIVLVCTKKVGNNE